MQCWRAHVQFLDAHYVSGKFIASGRKVPRTGGIILARAETPEELDRIIAQNPFKLLGLATCKVAEFMASKRSEQAYDLMA